MKNLLTSRSTVVTLLMTGCWVCARAESLGTPAAEVLMGHPFEMNVPARFASVEGTEECVHADVFYGETPVAANTVRATVLGPPDRRRIRIESETPINEPIVTVSVRAGCRNTITRNYTLLPEFPSERALAVAELRNALASATPVAPLHVSTATGTSPRRPAVSSGGAPMAHRSILAQVTPEAAAKAPARRTHKARALDSGVARGPRLSLAAIDAPVPQGLRVTSTLAEPEGDAARRAAAALLWQAINADPQEILRTGAMLQSLEHELAQLQQNATQTHQEIAALRQRIDHAQPWYASATLPKLLALLVAAAATAAGVVWYRTRKLRGLGEAWYMPHQGHDAAPPEELVREDVSPRARPLPALAEGQAFVPPNVGVSDAPVRVSPLEAEKSVTVDFDLLDAQESKSEPPQRSADSARRVETLAATFGEVDFLVSLGLTQDAMDVLKAYVQDSDKPAPLAYLELMRLSEEAGDPVAVATVRRRYARAFRVEAPRLPQITADLGVDSVPDLSARLTRTWNSGDRLAMLEQVLLSVPTPAAPISVRAARELLSLHQLAQCMAAEEAGAGADEVPLAPWAHAVDAHEAHAAAVDAADAQGGAQFGLDVDLSDKAADAAEVSTSEAAQSQLAPFLEEIQAASRHEAARRQQEEEDAFSAAVASERIPVSRY